MAEPVSTESSSAGSTTVSQPEEAEPASEPEPQPLVQIVRFSATGDNLIHAPIYKQAQRRASGEKAYSFDYCYEHIAPFYAQHDVNWINQETLCTDELEPSTYPCFSTPGDCARALYRAGVRVFSLSNNHIALMLNEIKNANQTAGGKGIVVLHGALPALPLPCASGAVCRRM